MGIEKVGPKGADAAASQTPAETAAAGRHRFWRVLAQQWMLLVVVVATIGIQGAVFLTHRMSERAQQLPSGEVDLGTFHFDADKSEGGQVSRAEFCLHVALQEAAGTLPRQRLIARQFRIQQDIEELLRRAHGGDFDDPGLQDLKRQLQEQIDQTLGTRAVADVIVTSLRLQRGSLSKPPVQSTADAGR